MVGYASLACSSVPSAGSLHQLTNSGPGLYNKLIKARFTFIDTKEWIMVIARPKGTADFLPETTAKWQEVEALLRTLAREYGFGEIRTPLFE
mgnify:CR=1 FL=1